LPVLLFTFIISFFFLWNIVISNGGSIILELELFSTSRVSFSFILYFDKISLSFGIVVTLIAGRVFTFAHKYIEEDCFSDRFLLILIAFVISINLLTFSGSLLILLLGWDGLGITSFALIIYYQSFDSLRAGFQTLMVNRVGDALIVLSTFLFVCTHQLTFISLSDVFFEVGLVLILSIAALTKRAQYPFSSWLPAAMAAPTPVSALVHSSTLVTAGIFLIIRLSYNIPIDDIVKSILIFVGAITCLLGGWAATNENDVKKIIALSTLSQLGVIVFRLGLGLPNLALFHLYTHALFKALLFLAAGNILISGFGSQDIRLIGGVGVRIPFTVVIFNIRRLCLIGGPFLRAFYSKHIILEKITISSINTLSFIIMLAATIFTAKYVIRTLKAVSWRKPYSSILSVSSNFYTSFPVFLLGGGSIVAGKILVNLDLINFEVAFISGFWGGLINLVTVVGVLLGLTEIKKKNRFFLSTLFFLTPSLTGRTKNLVKFSKELRVLDFGWLEPLNLVKSYHINRGALLSSLGAWPYKQTFFRIIILFPRICFILFLV